MRNRYPGTCYRCAQPVAPGDGHFERYKGGWRTQHASCAIKHRKPQLAVGQRWVLDGDIVRVTGWGQDNGGAGLVKYVSVNASPDDESWTSMSGKAFRAAASPVIEAAR